jgi:hypothetical protein
MCCYDIFHLTGQQCTCKGNAAQQFGGAVWVKSNGDITISDCLFSQNQCSGDGAALVLDMNNITSDATVATTQQRHLQQQQQQQVPPAVAFTISGTVFDNNAAVSTADAILVLKGVLNITNCTVQNHAQADHSAIRVDNDDIHIAESVFDNNLGGAIFTGAANSGAIIARASNFTNNYSLQAAAIVGFGSLYMTQVLDSLCDYHIVSAMSM